MTDVRMPSRAPLPETSSGSPGSILRRCREFHGLTLDEASESTKIGISHLKALEEDQISEFANQAYLKGFLRIYATYLGLNSDDISRMYDKLFGVQNEKTGSEQSVPAPVRQRRAFITLKKLVYPAILLVAIIVTASFFKREPAPPSRHVALPAAPSAAPQNASIQSQTSSVNMRKAVTEPEAPPVRKRAVEPAESDTPAPVKHPVDTEKGFILKIKVTQNGALTSTVDGASPQQYDLTIGDIIEWKAEKKVTLELSNSGSVDVELNGKPYKSLGQQGRSVYFEFDAEGIRQ